MPEVRGSEAMVGHRCYGHLRLGNAPERRSMGLTMATKTVSAFVILFLLWDSKREQTVNIFRKVLIYHETGRRSSSFISFGP